MGRRERPIEDDGGPVPVFAAELRRLRAAAGSPTYRALAERTHYAASVLSAATRGAQLPTWPVVRAFVLACGGSEPEWRERWDAADRLLRPAMVPAPGDGRALRTLPAAPGLFSGRAAELDQLEAFALDSDGELSLVAISGMAGVGKTALALRTAHRLAGHFPDGQYWLDLQGYTEGMAPRNPADALAVMLSILGLLPAQIPADLEARAALYRDRLFGSKTLIVLDNAVDENQIRPLLPGAQGCFVLVTSRRRLKSVDAYPVALDVLAEPDAVTLLRRASGLKASAADDAALQTIARLCGHLPLALRVSGALLRHRPKWTAQLLADKMLEGSADLLGSREDGDLATLFALSYNRLPERHQHLFRLLGRVPGPDIDLPAAAALLDAPVAETERIAQSLLDLSLVEEHEADRYRMHDLVRLYARSLSEHGEPGREACAALGRLCRFYSDNGARADARIARFTRPGAAAPAEGLDFTDQSSALRWLRREYPNVRACIGFAAAHGEDESVISLTAVLAAISSAHGPWTEAIALHEAAAVAAERAGDPVGQANALVDAGAIHLHSGAFATGRAQIAAAAEHYHAAGEQTGIANTLTWQGVTRRVTGDLVGALADFESALARYDELGDRRGRAIVLTDMGMAHYLAGDATTAIHEVEESRALHTELGNPTASAQAASLLGGLRSSVGDVHGALEILDEALDLLSRLGNHSAQANALVEKGVILGGLGQTEQALAAVEESLELHRRLGNRLGRVVGLQARARVLRASGDTSAALRDFEESLASCRALGSRGNEAWILNQYADTLVEHGEYERAAIAFAEALEVAEETDLATEQVLALEGLGECRVRAGASADGVELLTRALAKARTMKSPDADRLERRLAELG
ncbi:ATP-binding protein [Actinospica robiniae]|uniref:ATP-binding protein n=1 Tax=Actinospica robiniae TaxID=304901 RepID=UPI0003F935CA|nr:tetratricopeptide repeat protein [Actinospica robiniae]